MPDLARRWFEARRGGRSVGRRCVLANAGRPPRASSLSDRLFPPRLPLRGGPRQPERKLFASFSRKRRPCLLSARPWPAPGHWTDSHWTQRPLRSRTVRHRRRSSRAAASAPPEVLTHPGGSVSPDRACSIGPCWDDHAVTIVWFIVAVGFDVAAWSALRLVSALAENPGSASALALCWVHVFILPPLLARPWRGLLRLILTATLGVAAAAIALAAGFLSGLQVGTMALLIGFAFYDPYTGAYHEPPGPLLQTLQDVLSDVILWSGFAAGSAVALSAAVGLAGIQPGSPRPRLSWWLVTSGAWASIVFLPDWLIRSLQTPWREPILLAIAGAPSILVLLGRHGIVSAKPG